jgi:hypothetical protein
VASVSCHLRADAHICMKHGHAWKQLAKRRRLNEAGVGTSNPSPVAGALAPTFAPPPLSGEGAVVGV